MTMFPIKTRALEIEDDRARVILQSFASAHWLRVLRRDDDSEDENDVIASEPVRNASDRVVFAPSWRHVTVCCCSMLHFLMCRSCCRYRRKSGQRRLLRGALMAYW
jgi:hypothetical protein